MSNVICLAQGCLVNPQNRCWLFYSLYVAKFTILRFVISRFECILWIKCVVMVLFCSNHVGGIIYIYKYICNYFYIVLLKVSKKYNIGKAALFLPLNLKSTFLKIFFFFLGVGSAKLSHFPPFNCSWHSLISGFRERKDSKTQMKLQS